MPMANLANVGIEIHHSQRKLYFALARMLRERHGAKIHFYVRGPLELRGFKRRYDTSLWDSITDSAVFVPALKAPADPDALVKEAQALEARIGEPINTLAIANRHLNAGYSPGSFRHPRAPRIAGADQDAVLAGLVAQLRFWDNEIAEKKLTLILDAGKAAACMARANGIAYRWFVFARLASRRAWAHDEFGANPLLRPAYDALESWPAASVSDSYGALHTKNRRVRDNRRLVRQVLNLPRAIARQWIQGVRGRDRTADYALKDIIGGPFRVARAQREVASWSQTTLDDLKCRPFAYFPLQKEPEIALMQMEPESLNQLATVMGLSAVLPAGARLAVKEHLVTVGRRPADFYRQIAALPNARLLSMSCHPIETIRQATVTVTIAGTAALEAAILGHPAIVFGRRTPAAFLDHVFAVRSHEELRDAIAHIFAGKVDREKAREDGARFEEALRQASFDMGALGDQVTETAEEIPEEMVTVLHDELVKSMAVAAAPLMEVAQ
jgi:hypothetical protein